MNEKFVKVSIVLDEDEVRSSHEVTFSVRTDWVSEMGCALGCCLKAVDDFWGPLILAEAMSDLEYEESSDPRLASAQRAFGDAAAALVEAHQRRQKKVRNEQVENRR